MNVRECYGYHTHVWSAVEYDDASLDCAQQESDSARRAPSVPNVFSGTVISQVYEPRIAVIFDRQT